MSNKLPIRRDQLRHHLTAFIGWLNDYGAEVGQPTNPYEVVRYRAYWKASHKAQTHVIYAKENGLLTWTGATMEHFKQFLDGERPAASMRVPAPVPAKANKVSATEQRRKQLLARDGDECWFCGTAMGDDCTIEHLVPKSKGGANHLDNYALAHRECNAKAADAPLVVKIAMRSELRAKQEQNA